MRNSSNLMKAENTKKSCHSLLNEWQTRLACDVNKISSESSCVQCLSELSLRDTGDVCHPSELQNFGKRIYSSKLKPTRFWTLAWAVYLHVIRHSNHILTCRSSQIWPSLREFSGFLFSVFQSNIAELATFDIVSFWIISPSIRFLLAFWGNSGIQNGGHNDVIWCCMTSYQQGKNKYVIVLAEG